MAHLRQQIRERVATTLTGLTTTGSNVFQSRVYPIENTKLPCLLIYTREESSEPLDMGPPRTIEKRLSLVIEGYVKANSNYDDTIDTITKEVEVAMYGDRLINNLAKDSFLVSTDISFNGEGDNPLGIVVMTFEIPYHHTEGTLE
jgi:hypothetical protein|tara:strand:+ start:686 stop:1120 length:435 start_codon:yes stop_codon:yes gene_type:complete